MAKFIIYSWNFIFFFLIFASLGSNSISLVLKKTAGIENTGILKIFLFLFFLTSLIYLLSEWILKNKDAKKEELETFYNEPDKAILEKIKSNDPDFEYETFLKNVGSLVEKLNKAWCENKMSQVRNLVSAGVYNRFKIQIELMKKQNLKNVMQHWALSSTDLIEMETDDDYQTAHVQIFAYAKDLNVSYNLPNSEIEKLFLEAKQTSYTEIFSFVRKKTGKTFKGKSLLEGNCPNCGAPIEGLGESNQCAHCHTIINSGEYDWVLAEITQVEVWNEGSTNDLNLAEFKEKNKLVARQIIEDRASYLFWRYMESLALGTAEPVRRDSNPAFIENWNEEKIQYEDVAVGAVDLEEIYFDGDAILADVNIQWSQSFNPEESIFTLRLEPNATKNSGLAENSCSNCGAPYPDSDAHACEYCNHPIPKVVNDWLLYEIDHV
jgi:hypothetical protein